MELNKKQAIVLVILCTLSNKVQRLPSLLATNLGRHGWLVFLIMGGIDLLFLIIALWFNYLAKNKTTYEICKNAGGSFFAKAIFVLFAIYFFVESLLPFEAVHDLFANILFDHLSWSVYSLILVATVLFLASRGLRNIGRTSEIFFYIIVLSFIVLIGLGTNTTNLNRILPFADVNLSLTLKSCFDYNLWFGDFLVIYIFVGKIKNCDKKFNILAIISFAVYVLVVSFTYMVFYGLYEHLSPDRNSLISSISQFALLDLDIGRVDWFLVLFFQIDTIIASAFYLYASGYAIAKVFNIKKYIYVLVPLVGALYFVDIFLFSSIQVVAKNIALVTRFLGLFMIFVLPFILLIVCFVSKKKDKLHLKKYNLEKYSFLVSKRQFEEASAKVQGSVARTLVKKDNKKRKAKVEK